MTICLTLLVTGFVGWQIVRLQHYPFDSDEALHAVRGLALASDLRRGDLLAFWRTSYRQSVYPPGFAWFEALVFLLFGASALTARFCSLAAMAASTLAVYGIALELDEDTGWLAGLVAAALTLTSQGLLVHAGLVMLELPGLFVSLAALWAYLRARRRPAGWRFGAVGLLVALATLVKYPFGLILLPAIGLTELVETRRLGERAFPFRRWAWLLLPFLAVMAVWFIGEDKVEHFIYYATLQPKHADWYSLENLLFYPRVVALHYLPAPFFAPVTVAAVVWAVARWRRAGLRLLLFYALTGFLMMTLKESNNRRFIATVVPALHLLTGAMVARLAAIGARERRADRVLLLSGAASVLLLSLASLPTLVERFAVFPALLEVELETDPRAAELTAWIVEQTGGEPLYFVNTWDQFSALAMEWHLGVAGVGYDCCHDYLTVPEVYLEPFTPEEASALERDIRAYDPAYVVVLEGGVGVRQVWPEYARALEEDLVPLTAHQVDLTFYNLGDWLDTALVTRDTLAQAQADHRMGLTARAIIYRLEEE